MAGPRKIFRIEEMFSGGENPAELGRDPDQAERHGEVMAELRALRAAIAATKGNGDAKTAEVLQAQIVEARKFRSELDVIDQAIKKTKGDLVSLQDHGLDGGQISRVTQELNAVVQGTTDATDRILKSAETIEQTSSMLAASLKTEHEQGLAQDIQDQVTQIFEACNFHDLTSQRITKVLATLNQVQDHLGQMVEIWGAIERFTNYVAHLAPPSEAESMLNGPKLDGDPGHASQNDIDSMFH
jgi:chemotaxis protein CheZ